MEVLDKYSLEKIDEIVYDGRLEIQAKIKEAHSYFLEYRISPTSVRGNHIQVIIDLLKKHRSYLSELISREAGKPLFYAEAELDRCIRTASLGLTYFETVGRQKIKVDLEDTPFKESFTERFPVGVIFGISPFNFPLNLAIHKIIPAIASGNTILIKPSPYTPLCLNFLINEANKKLPKGLITMINCSNEDAEFIVKHPTIKLVSFTGSDKVGWHIKSLVPKKKVILELGGNAAVYVDESADLNELATTLAKAATLYAGQICISTQRIFVHRNIYDHFKSLLTTAFNSISSGKPLNNAVNGPLIDKVHLERLSKWIENARKKEQSILAGGSSISITPPILAPTLIECTDPTIELFQEEAFGPVAVLQKVNNCRDAISAINNSRYGLQAGIFTTNKNVQEEMYRDIDVGGLIINGIPGFRKDEMPYGGVKDSGFGREGIRYAMEEMTELKLFIR